MYVALMKDTRCPTTRGQIRNQMEQRGHVFLQKGAILEVVDSSLDVWTLRVERGVRVTCHYSRLQPLL